VARSCALLQRPKKSMGSGSSRWSSLTSTSMTTGKNALSVSRESRKRKFASEAAEIRSHVDSPTPYPSSLQQHIQDHYPQACPSRVALLERLKASING